MRTPEVSQNQRHQAALQLIQAWSGWMHGPGAGGRSDHAAEILQILRRGMVMDAGEPWTFFVDAPRLWLDQTRLEGSVVEGRAVAWVSTGWERLGATAVRLHPALQMDELERWLVWASAVLRDPSSGWVPWHGETIEMTFRPADDGLAQVHDLLTAQSRWELVSRYLQGIDWLTAALAAGRGQESLLPEARELVGVLLDVAAHDRDGLAAWIGQGPADAPLRVVRRWDTALMTAELCLALSLPREQVARIAAALLCGGGLDADPATLPSGSAPSAAAAALCRDPLMTMLHYEAAAGLTTRLPGSWGQGEIRMKHPLSRVLDVARAWCWLRWPADGAGPRCSGPAALQWLAQWPDGALDVEVLAAMIHRFGWYPPGSAVRLNDGDVAVVVSAPPPGTPLHRPAVRLTDDPKARIFALWLPECAAWEITGEALQASPQSVWRALLQ